MSHRYGRLPQGSVEAAVSLLLISALSGCVNFVHPDGSYDTVWLHPARSAQSQMENEKWKSPMTLLTPADYAYAKDAGMLGLRR